MKYPERKSQRIKNFDYSSQNYYFVTICTADRRHLLGEVNNLNKIGKIAERELLGIEKHYNGVKVDRYVIMPNHIHAIIKIGCDNTERTSPFPTLSAVIGSYKAGVSRLVHTSIENMKIWQKSFYDRIIRDEKGYVDICRYIDENPVKWESDEYY